MELLAAAAGALVGAVLGYVFRSREFVRDRRLEVYGEFVDVVLRLFGVTAGLQSAYVRLGEKVHSKDAGPDVWDLWRQYPLLMQEYHRAAAMVRVVASPKVLGELESVERFVVDNIENAPPFKPAANLAPAGSAASVGPAAVEQESIRTARRFAETARLDMVSRWRRPKPNPDDQPT